MAPESTAGAAHGAPGLAHHFDSFEQQRETALLGMWVFLVTEILFFGGLFTAYTVYRWQYPEAFALASNRLDTVLGGINTAVLLTSSLTMALAVRGAQLGRGRVSALLVLATIVLGGVFLGIKLFEYHHKFEEGLVPGQGFQMTEMPGAALFFCLYFGMTGLHAIHMVVGMALLAGVGIAAWVGRFTPENHNFVEGMGLYWHFVDIVWIFLFPLLYLMGRHI